MDVQAAHLKSNHSSKEVTKIVFGLGLLPCDKECKILLEQKSIHSEFQQCKQVLAEVCTINICELKEHRDPGLLCSV